MKKLYLITIINTIISFTNSNATVLQPSDAIATSHFGVAVSLNGTSVIVGNSYKSYESVYFYNDLENKSVVNETLKIKANDRVDGNYFGYAVSLSNNNAVIGAFGTNSVYFYSNIGTAEQKEIKFGTPNSPSIPGNFGYSVSLSDSNAVIGTLHSDDNGEAYVYTNLGNNTTSISETSKLIASDGAEGDVFGCSVSLSKTTAIVGARGDDVAINENNAIIGAYGKNNYQGAAYLYTNLDKATGTIIETAKLVASDGSVENDKFGAKVAISGTNAFVSSGSYRGEWVYLYTNINAASETVTESIKFILGNGESGFLTSVSADGENFVFGRCYKNQVLFGKISTFTILDKGNVSQATGGLSFESRNNWIIGENTSKNRITLSFGDSATSKDMKVFIGRNNEADENYLILEDLTSEDDLIAYLGSTNLFADKVKVLADNYNKILKFKAFESGGFLIAAVPEPATYAAIFDALAFALAVARKRK